MFLPIFFRPLKLLIGLKRYLKVRKRMIETQENSSQMNQSKLTKQVAATLILKFC